jgi:fluoride exporter
VRSLAAAYVAVFVGGMLGTSLRLGLDTLIPHAPTQFPVSTLTINIVGSFVLGALVARYWPTARGWVKAGLGPGLLGGFTTFSAVMVSLVAQAAAGEWLLAAGYLVATLALGMSAAAAGLWVGARSRPALAGHVDVGHSGGIEVDE